MKDELKEVYDLICQSLEVPIDEIMHERQRQLDIVGEYGDTAIIAIHVMSGPTLCRIMNQPSVALLITLSAEAYPPAIRRKITDVNRRLGQSKLTLGVGCGVTMEINDESRVG